MIAQYMALIAGALFLLREISHLIVFKNSMKRLKEQKLLLFSLIGEIYMLLISPYLWLGGRTTKTGKWR
jgi:hypothetical protein